MPVDIGKDVGVMEGKVEGESSIYDQETEEKEKRQEVTDLKE